MSFLRFLATINMKLSLFAISFSNNSTPFTTPGLNESDGPPPYQVMDTVESEGVLHPQPSRDPGGNGYGVRGGKNT